MDAGDDASAGSKGQATLRVKDGNNNDNEDNEKETRET